VSAAGDLTAALVAIDSVNPALVSGGAGEGEIARFVAEWARGARLDAEMLEATPGRPSVLVRARGTGGGRTLLLCGHLDTVGVREAASLGLAGDVVVAAVADEEHASLGVREALGAVTADAAIVTEPTELELIVAHKGFVWAEVEVTGRAAHGSRPHLGVDAIVRAGPVLTALGELDDALAERTHPLLGRGSVHASLIRGGEELSSYPARCVLSLERRTLPGEGAAHVEAELAGLLDECRAADPHLEASHRILLEREPFEVAPDAEIAGLVRAAAAETLGSEPPVGGASYWADAAFIAAAGIPTVMFGPRGEGAHAVEEWVSLADTEAVARTLVAVARRLCS
jgi:acetylornithine deacetylase